MIDFNSVLDNALQLSPHDQVRLINALWNSVPDDLDVSLHPDWEAELERRVAKLQSGMATMTPWSQIRSEALATYWRSRR